MLSMMACGEYGDDDDGDGVAIDDDDVDGVSCAAGVSTACNKKRFSKNVL